MSASDHAQRERLELCDLLVDLGPDSPTLCDGWTTRDLAAHLVVRESRPDAMLGINGGPTAGWTEHVQNQEARNDYLAIVAKVRTGPPLLSLFSLPGVAGIANLAEFVVHHEDVIRAQAGWQPRQLPTDLSDDLWNRLRVPARRTFQNPGSGITLIRTDGDSAPFVVHDMEPMITVSGSALEVLMVAYGRRAVHVTVEGGAAAVEQFRSQYLGSARRP